MEKNLECVREIECVRKKTVRDYIYDLGRTELDHDYKAEVKRIIAMLDDHDKAVSNYFANNIARLEKKVGELEIINSCLAKCVREMREKYE